MALFGLYKTKDDILREELQDQRNINEELTKKFLATDNSPKDLSTTATKNDEYGPNIKMNYQDYMHGTANMTSTDLIPLWRSMELNYLEALESLEEIVNTAIVPSDIGKFVKVDFVADDLKISDKTKDEIYKEWDYIYHNLLNLDEKGEFYFKRFYIDGQMYTELVYDNKNMKAGIQEVLLLEPFGIKKCYDSTTGSSVYVKKANTGNKTYYNDFYYDSRENSKEKDKKWQEEQMAFCNSNIYDENRKLYISYLNFAVRPLNQLYAIENSMVVYTLTRSQSRLVYYVDVGRMPDAKAKAKLEEIAMKNQSVDKYDRSSGKVHTQVDKIKLNKEMFVARRNGERDTQIEDISSDSMDVGEIPAVKYFQDKSYRALRTPDLKNEEKSVISIGTANEVEKSELNKNRFVEKNQTRFAKWLMDILKKQLLSKGLVTEEEWNDVYKTAMKLVFNATNDYAEIKKLNVLQRRIEALDSMSEYVLKDENDAIVMFPREFVLKNIMKFTDAELKQIDEQIKKEKSTRENINTDIGADKENEKKEVDESYIPFDDEEFDFEKTITEDVECDIDELESYIKEKGLVDGDELVIGDNLKYVYQDGKLKEK